MIVTLDTHDLEKQLSAPYDVRQVSFQWKGERQLHIVVVLDRFDWELREHIIELIDDFHRAHVNEISVDFDVVDLAHAARVHQYS